MNDKYLKPWFQKNPLTDKEQFLDLYKQLSIQLVCILKCFAVAEIL